MFLTNVIIREKIILILIFIAKKKSVDKHFIFLARESASKCEEVRNSVVTEGQCAANNLLDEQGPTLVHHTDFQEETAFGSSHCRVQKMQKR